MKPRLYIEQKITAFVNKYNVFGADKNGEQSDLLALAQQKRLAFKEKVNFFTDEQKTAVVYTFRAEKVLDVHGRYLVEDENGKCIGMFKKDFKQSLLNSTWLVMDREGLELFKINESSTALALFRRFAGWIPVVGGLADILTLFLRYHFVIADVGDGTEVGRYQKTTLIRDHYVLTMTDSAFEKSDWRVLAAMGVGLDALQSR